MFTSSSIHALNTSGKGGKMFGQTAMTYIYEKIAEIITGECKTQVKSASLDWGNNNEKDAAMWLADYHKIQFEYMGKENFKFFEYSAFSGGSPDGLSDTHVIEIKCPYNSSNHVGWLLGERGNDWVKANYPEYYAQVQWNMQCCKRDMAIIASYDPRTTDAAHRMATYEIVRDEPYLENLRNRVDAGVEIIRDALKSINL